jgi:hypothetical protein
MKKIKRRIAIQKSDENFQRIKQALSEEIES